ncbi:MAG TPA: glycosyltransferase family 39 protein, partial [Vicinamibacteria bacterium]|nr:glycosyltransferase family 39 protein [Vicinamibacteria bacterium]
MLRASTLAALALGASALVQAGHAARVQGWTYDEPIHLAWSERLLATGEWERESRERFNSKTPIVIPSVLAARASGAADVARTRFAARLPTVAWLAALLGLVFAVGRERFGPAAGGLAAAACALDPNLVANASLVTVDVPFAAATLLLLWSAVRAFERPSAGRAVLAGAAFGL